MLIDTHCHLNDERLIRNIDSIVKQFDENNLFCAVNIGYDFESSRISVKLAENYSKIYAAAGIHPENIDDADNDAFDSIIKLCNNKKVVAVGEIGLDYHYIKDNKEEQKDLFVKQLEIAHSLKLPVIIHSRDAAEDTYNILNDNKDKIKNGVLMHCYSGSAEMVKQLERFDCYFAFGGIITYSNSKKAVVNAVPDDRLLIETDCPYNTPVPFKGTLNYPYYIKYTAQKIAEFKGKTHEEIENLTTQNALNIFKKIKY